MHYIASSRNPRIRLFFTLTVVAQQAADEVGRGLERKLRRFPAWIVTDTRQHRRLDRTEAFLLGRLDLPEGSVLVFVALYDQHGHADVAQHLGDIPLAELRIEPRLAPGAEGAIHVGVPALELIAQRPSNERVTRAADLRESHLFDEKVRREQHQAAHPVILHRARIYGGDGGAVAVAEQDTALETDSR